jgi:hypothetical protein
VLENAFEHGCLHDRQQLLGSRVSERPQARPLAANQDDSFHPIVVVVPAEVLEVVLPEVLELVVVVVFAAVVEVLPLAVVVVVPGLVVDVIGGKVLAVVVAVVALSAFRTAITTLPSGRAMFAPFGTNATVISSVDCVKRTVRRSPPCVVPELAVAVGQIFATNSPVLPASGVPDGHRAPSV